MAISVGGKFGSDRPHPPLLTEQHAAWVHWPYSPPPHLLPSRRDGWKANQHGHLDMRLCPKFHISICTFTPGTSSLAQVGVSWDQLISLGCGLPSFGTPAQVPCSDRTLWCKAGSWTRFVPPGSGHRYIILHALDESPGRMELDVMGRPKYQASSERRGKTSNTDGQLDSTRTLLLPLPHTDTTCPVTCKIIPIPTAHHIPSSIGFLLEVLCIHIARACLSGRIYNTHGASLCLPSAMVTCLCTFYTHTCAGVGVLYSRFYSIWILYCLASSGLQTTCIFVQFLSIFSPLPTTVDSVVPTFTFPYNIVFLHIHTHLATSSDAHLSTMPTHQRFLPHHLPTWAVQ